MGQPRYVKPSVGTRLFNGLLAGLARLGVSIYGSQMLVVRGRASGELRTVPVNPLTFQGARYLVAPRGETQWVRNLRVARRGELRLGRQREAFRAEELRDEDKPPVLRAYLEKWAFEVKAFFGGVDANASEAELLAISASHPVFRIEPLAAPPP